MQTSEHMRYNTSITKSKAPRYSIWASTSPQTKQKTNHEFYGFHEFAIQENVGQNEQKSKKQKGEAI